MTAIQAWQSTQTAPALLPGTVHVWQDRLDRPWTSDPLSAADEGLASRHKVPERRAAFTRGRLLAGHLLAQYLGHPAVVEVDDKGKPFIVRETRDPELHISLAHSGNVLLIGVSHAGEIGVDVEQIDPAVDHEVIARRFFAPEEMAALTALAPAERERAFFRCWTRKEAFVKALGDGLGRSLSSFAVSTEDMALSTVSPKSSAGDWRIHDLASAVGYAGALAVRRAETVMHRLRFAP